MNGCRVLVLGGTAEAFALAVRLHADPNVVAISSLAGRLARPRLPPGEVRIGGFGGADGLAAYLREERIDATIDATHPFAATISRNAVRACARADIPLLVLERPRWEEVAGDRWERVPDMASAVHAARALGPRIFLTIGRTELAAFAGVDDRWFLVRAIEPPAGPLPPQHELLLARGPFTVAAEIATMRAHAIDAIVAKDSGGAATAAKLVAARALGLPVVIVDRPFRSGAASVNDLDAALAWLRAASVRFRT